MDDASKLEEGGVDGIIIENYGDYPYLPVVKNPATISAMAIIVHEIIKEVSIPVGVSFLRNSAIASVGIAYVTGARFIRVNAYVENISTDSGIIQAAAPLILRYLRSLDGNLAILADIKVKHATPLGDYPILEIAKDAFARGRASAIIVTGTRTGEPPNHQILLSLRESGIRPILIGSGLNPQNIKLLEYADGAIVGTYFKRDGITTNPVDMERVRKFISMVKNFR